jgi:hypothetical protein
MKTKTKETIIIILITTLILSIIGFIFGFITLLWDDYNSNKCLTETTFSIVHTRHKLCRVTPGGSFTYTTTPIFFEPKSCEVNYTC